MKGKYYLKWAVAVLVGLALMALAATAWAGDKATPSTVPTLVAPGQVPAPTSNVPRHRVSNAPWTPSVRADPDSTTVSCLDGGLSVTGPGKVITAYNWCKDGSTWPWRICNSTNAGATWTAQTVLPGNQQFDDISCSNKVDSCIELVMKNVSGYTLYFKRSTDSGVTWGDTMHIPQAGSGSGVDYPKIDQRGPYLLLGYYDGNIGYCRSTDWGVTWNTSQQWVSTSSGQGNCPRFSKSPSTNAYFVWGQPAAWQPSTIWFNKSTDLGATWGTPVQILALNMSSDFPSTRASHTFAVMDVAPNGDIYCVVQDMLQGTGWDVAFIKSTNQGTTWSTPVRVNDDVSTPNADQLEPWIEVDAYGNLHVFWMDNRNYYSTNPYACDVYYSYSTNQGVTWAPNEQVNDITPISLSSGDFSRMGDYQVIDSDPTRVYCQWTQCNAAGTAGSDFTSSRLLPAAYAQFMLAAKAADTMNTTASKTDSVTVSSFLSFNRPVTMALDSIRPATGTITVSFSPNPVTPPPNGSIKTGMNITTTATPQNNYVIYYHGTGDTITRRASMNLWVTLPTFVLSSTPRVQTIFTGDSASYADTLVSISGFNSPCTLSATVNPPTPSITVSFIPNNVVVPTDGRRMKVQTTGVTPSGGYGITITGRSGSLVKTVDDSLYVKYPLQGPDSYGYYAYDNTDVIFQNKPTYSWIELNPSRGGNGTTVGISGDDATLRLATTGVRARHYGYHGDSISVCTNGWLAIGRTTLSVYSNVALPSTSFVPGGVAGIWDDQTVSGTGTCWYRRDAGQRFIVEWDSLYTLGGTYAGTFEIIVMDTSQTPGTANTRDSEIILQWKGVGNISSATVGQQNQAMTVGLNSYANGVYDPQMAPIVAGRATKYTTDPPRLVSGVELLPVGLGLPLHFALGPAVPNPSKGYLAISYDLPVEAQVSLKVYNLSGQLVRTLVSGKEQAGFKRAAWDGRSDKGSRVASGVYFYRLEAGSFTATKKLVMVR